jgi:hypothetical protein
MHAMSHLTRHAPSSHFQKKFLLSLLIFVMSHFDILKIVAWYVTVRVKIDFTNYALAVFDINFPF